MKLISTHNVYSKRKRPHYSISVASLIYDASSFPPGPFQHQPFNNYNNNYYNNHDNNYDTNHVDSNGGDNNSKTSSSSF